MALLSNSPNSTQVSLRLEQRKSFSFSLQLYGNHRNKLDVTDCEFRFVIQKDFYPNTTIVDTNAASIDAANGYVRFDVQATDLDVDAGSYNFAIVMVTPEGYSVVLAKGSAQVLFNPDTFSLESSYTAREPVEGLEVVFRGGSRINVATATILPPGMNFFTDAERQMLNDLVTDMNTVTAQCAEAAASASAAATSATEAAASESAAATSAAEVAAIRDDVKARSLTATIDPNNTDLLVLSFPDFMLAPDGTSVLIPVEEAA